MEDTEILNSNLLLSGNLPFSNCSVDQIEQEFLGEKRLYMKSTATVNFSKIWLNLQILSHLITIVVTTMI